MIGRWFKFREATLFDRRAQKLPAGLFRTYVNLLCARSWSGGRLPSIEDAAFLLRTSVAVLTRRLEALKAAGLVAERDGEWIIAGDGDEESARPEPLSGAERTKRWRNRREAVTASDGGRDVSVTDGDAPEREESLERENLSARDARECDGLFETFLSIFPKREDGQPRAPALAGWRKAISSGADPDRILSGAKAYAEMVKGREAKFVCSAARWLSEERWRDAGLRPRSADAAKQADVPPPGIWIRFGCSEWEAWADHWRSTKGKSPPRDARGGWRFPSLLPPQPKSAAVAA